MAMNLYQEFVIKINMQQKILIKGDGFMGIFENTWFVGISTGIISGILVFFITKWIVDKKGKAEYYRQVASANNNVINALKPYIADKGLPDVEIFKALISSTARAYGINEKDMYEVDVYCEELIREIISDVYVSNEKKKEYTDSLSVYKANLVQQKKKMDEVKLPTGRYGEILKRRISIYMGVISSFMGVVMSILVLLIDNDTEMQKTFWYPFEDNPVIWIPIMMIFVIFIMLILVMSSELLLKITKRRIRIGNDTNSQESKDKQ